MAETVVMTLTEFLLARIAEDETAIARRQAAVDETNDAFPDTPAELCDCIGIVDGAHDWNCPARALAECEAKRDLVRVCTAELAGRDIEGAMSDGDDGPWLADHVLHTMVLPYADHPDCDEAWRP